MLPLLVCLGLCFLLVAGIRGLVSSVVLFAPVFWFSLRASPTFLGDLTCTPLVSFALGGGLLTPPLACLPWVLLVCLCLAASFPHPPARPTGAPALLSASRTLRRSNCRPVAPWLSSPLTHSALAGWGGHKQAHGRFLPNTRPLSCPTSAPAVPRHSLPWSDPSFIVPSCSNLLHIRHPTVPSPSTLPLETGHISVSSPSPPIPAPAPCLWIPVDPASFPCTCLPLATFLVPPVPPNVSPGETYHPG